MAKFLTPTVAYFFGGLALLFIVIGAQLYLLLVLAVVPAQSSQPKLYSTAALQKEYQNNGIFSKTGELNKTQASSATVGLQYKPEDLGKTDLSKSE